MSKVKSSYFGNVQTIIYKSLVNPTISQHVELIWHFILLDYDFSRVEELSLDLSCNCFNGLS
jgi:hypothetical protein